MAKLLIADDEPIERAALAFVLRNSNFDLELIEEAVNGRQAVAKTLKYLPDIVIMDIKMPGIDGLEAARRIKAIFPECKIVLLTAYGYFDYAQTAIRIGVEDYIVKPVDSDNLIEVIQKVLTKIAEEKLQKNKYVETETKLRQVTQCFRNEILSSMMADDIEEERIGEYISHLGIVFKLGIAVVAAFDNNESLTLAENGWFKRLQEICFNYGVEYLFNQQHNRINILLIINDIDESNPAISAIFDALENINNQSDYRLSIGVSKPFTHIALVSKAFFQACVACNKSEEQVIFYNRLMDGKKGDLKYPLVKEKILYENLIKGEQEATLAAFHEIWDWMARTSETKEELKEKAYQFIVIIHRLVIQEFNIDDRLEYYCTGLQPLTQINELGAYCERTLL